MAQNFYYPPGFVASSLPSHILSPRDYYPENHLHQSARPRSHSTHYQAAPPPQTCHERGTLSQSFRVTTSTSKSSSTSPVKMAESSLAVCPPRPSRSLSPLPDRKASGTSPSPSLNRSASDREGKKGAGMLISLCPQLTPSQVLLIRKSWRHVNTKAFNGVLRRCFQRLETSCPCVAGAFAAASNSLSTCPSNIRTLADHAKYLGGLLLRVIESDECADEELRNVGAAHVRVQTEGFGSKEFERFGEILVEAMLKLDGIQQSKETSRAWRMLLCAVVDVVRDGFDSELRQTRRKSSFVVHSEYFNGLEIRRGSTPGSPRKSSLNLDIGSHLSNGRKYSDLS